MTSGNFPLIDRDKCTGCRICILSCPDLTLTLQKGKALVTGEKCMQCGHCAALCPEEAIAVCTPKNKELLFATFSGRQEWIPYGRGDTAALVQLMRSRRSCRNYTEQPVAAAVLEDLVKIGTTAPSGTNSQHWTFTLIPERAKVVRLGEAIAAFYHKLNCMAVNPLLRLYTRLFDNDSLGRYYRRYYKTVHQGLAEWDSGGRDRLFHGAPAVILVGATRQASCPAEDAALATQNMLLAAHCMGLGTCLIGFAVEAIKRDKKLRRLIGLDHAEEIYMAVALGYPREKYRRLTGRKIIGPRYPAL